ncbi:MAG: hypothetical protein QNJ72_01965 [Pleurocapsa sp. MO_226.B13]|nr:hypothetical protein [Pleurocapsa sp. MO_226.B13]
MSIIDLVVGKEELLGKEITLEILEVDVEYCDRLILGCSLPIKKRKIE